jgi:transmembrane sensor
MSNAIDIETQAALWMTRYEAARGATEQLAGLEEWLNADVRHRAAYLRLQTAWRRADLMKRIRPLDGFVDKDLLIGFVSRERRRARWLTAMAAVLAAMAVGLATWFWVMQSDWRTFDTEIGGLARVVLEDGSQMSLNTATEVRARIGVERREIELLRGEAQFVVAPDPHRPFDVRAGETTVRAVGTAFSVRLHGDNRVDVLVREGRVLIDAPRMEKIEVGELPMPAPTLSAGEVATVHDSAVEIERIAGDALARRLAWTDGWIVFDGDPLAYAVAELNRYNRRQVVIANSEIADLRVGGRFQATDPESFVAALEKWSGVKVSSPSGGEAIEIR